MRRNWNLFATVFMTLVVGVALGTFPVQAKNFGARQIPGVYLCEYAIEGDPEPPNPALFQFFRDGNFAFADTHIHVGEPTTEELGSWKTLRRWPLTIYLKAIDFEFVEPEEPTADHQQLVAIRISEATLIREKSGALTGTGELHRFLYSRGDPLPDINNPGDPQISFPFNLTCDQRLDIK